MNFQYFDYGEERRYSFLQVPKLLLEEPEFKSLSGDAKLLYSLMLDRGSMAGSKQSFLWISMSPAKNRWNRK